MKHFLVTHRNYIFFSSILFMIFSSFFFIVGLTDQTFSFYKEAVTQVKKDSLVPKSVRVYLASYNETQVILEFSDKDLEGVESGKILAVYTYSGTDEGKLNYYFQGTASHAFAYYGLVNNERFPSYVTGDSLHPFVLIGIISLSFSLIVGIISRIKWRYEATFNTIEQPDFHNHTIESSIEQKEVKNIDEINH